MTYNFDFNHGSAKPADDPRAPDFSDRVNAHIDAHFFGARTEEGVREYVGASGIGNECLRSVQLSYLGIQPDEGRITGSKLRIFNAGHRWEDILADWMRLAGFTLDTLNPETGKQYGWQVLGGAGKGHVDGILRAGPLPLQYPCLWECKALNEKGWQDVKKRGLAISKPIYAAQCAINQAYMDLTAPTVFTVLNKNTEELHHELVHFDQPFAQRMSDRILQVAEATKHQQLLPRSFNDPSNFMCQHFCDFYKTCWKKLK